MEGVITKQGFVLKFFFVGKRIVAFVDALDGRFVNTGGDFIDNVSALSVAGHKAVVAKAFEILGDFKLFALNPGDDV